ncbi:hypothetical protein KCU92_g202, partial [Aureobasidium melanogenum]
MSLSSCIRRSFASRTLQSFACQPSTSIIRPAALAYRPFSLSTKFANEHQEKPEHDALDASEAATQLLEPSEDATPSSTELESVPWYLQVDTPTPQQEHPFAERQKLPDLPESPPALLQPILEHVSVELGLDHLSFIDLRQLDPPPALGANLLMIIGTARSEKHLHVSADRLCRWLRTEHHLTPYADGLLGRNELKLKLRRKAKRSRLLSAVGAKETASQDLDDGIRTGWVCVNVGRVEGGALQKPAEDMDNIVGFGSQSSGSRIVVQMMTDEKRGQIDLETLWSGILKRSIKAKTDKDQEVDDAEKRVRSGMLLEESTDRPVDSRLEHTTLPPNIHFNKVRKYQQLHRSFPNLTDPFKVPSLLLFSGPSTAQCPDSLRRRIGMHTSRFIAMPTWKACAWLVSSQTKSAI